MEYRRPDAHAIHSRRGRPPHDRVLVPGLHVAVLTSDDRQSTLNFLKQERVEPDALHCGDDGRGHKPSAEPLLALASVRRTPFSAVAFLVHEKR